MTGGTHSELTDLLNTSKLVRMVFARTIFPFLLTVAVVAYGFDCSPTATAEQAMQCCKSMQCMRHHHQGQDCCKTMPTTRVDVVQPTPASSTFAPVVFGMVQAVDVLMSIRSSAHMIAERSHDPPLSSSPPISPLRI